MMTFTQQQFDAIEEDMFDRLQQRLRARIASVFPALAPQASNEPEAAAKRLSLLVEQGITRAVGVGIEGEAEWAAFIALGVALRERSDPTTPEWVVDCLNQSDLPGPSRMALVEWTLAENANADPSLLRVKQCLARARADAI